MAITPSFVHLPSDTGNTGKRSRTVQRTVNAVVVQESVVVTAYREDILGLYYGDMGPTPLIVGPHVAGVGFAYLVNPVGSAVTMALRRNRFVANIRSAVVGTATSPSIRLERFTFTGTPSGGVVTPAKRRSADAAAVGSVRLAATGMTITPGNTIRSFFVPTVAANSTAVPPPHDVTWDAAGDEGELLLLAGEGLLLRQATAGDASDPRDINFNITWLEY